jgi:hypothetical protein
VFDSSATLAVPPVAPIADYPVSVKHRRDEFPDSSIAAVGENAFVVTAEGLDF